MARLTDKQYWNDFWAPPESGLPSAPGILKAALRRSVGEKSLAFFTQSYAQHQIFEGIYRPRVPDHCDATVLEIGSAPGNYLLEMHRKFGMVPFGVDYSHIGVACNRELFTHNHLDARNVLEADAFAISFQEAHRGRFDVVMSLGVIEHFTGAELDSVIDAHINLIKPGGRLIVTIPNYQGLNYLLKLVFCRDNLAAHNLSIMRLDAFSRIFSGRGLRALFCGYAGTIDLSMATPAPGSRLKALYRIFDKSQVLLNGILRLSLRKKGFNLPWVSPFLVFVGVKGEKYA